MIGLMNRITDKKDWDKKVFDDAISSKWKTEALATPDTDISEKMVDYVGSQFPISKLSSRRRLKLSSISSI